MASYPSNVVVFSTHVNLTEVIDASHPNNIQAEIVAIENTLGANPHISTTPSSGGSFNGNSTTYASVAARLANIETGIVSDAHTHYLHKAGGDTIAPAAGTRGLTIQAPASQTVETFRVLSHDGVTNLIQVSSSEAVVLKSPTIADFTNAGHTHASAASGGALTQANTHGSPDTDAATTSLHHTIGTGANQAAPGTHPGTTSGTHGITGSFVGTSDVQTLTNKTLTSPVISTIVNTGTLTLPTSTDTLVGRNTTDTLTNKTLTTPVIGSFANAQHDHNSAAGGGTAAYATNAGTANFATTAGSANNATVDPRASGTKVYAEQFSLPVTCDASGTFTGTYTYGHSFSSVYAVHIKPIGFSGTDAGVNGVPTGSSTPLWFTGTPNRNYGTVFFQSIIVGT